MLAKKTKSINRILNFYIQNGRVNKNKIIGI